MPCTTALKLSKQVRKQAGRQASKQASKQDRNAESNMCVVHTRKMHSSDPCGAAAMYKADHSFNIHVLQYCAAAAAAAAAVVFGILSYPQQHHKTRCFQTKNSTHRVEAEKRKQESAVAAFKELLQRSALKPSSSWRKVSAKLQDEEAYEVND
jgi:negative regulator of sigma E activity